MSDDSEPQIVYLVVEVDSGNSYETRRVYSDRTEAEAFVEAHAEHTHRDIYEIEEMRLGAPDVAYDGPVWLGTWTTRRKQKGEKQLVLVSEDGFVKVVPSAVPSGGSCRYQEYFTPPGWRDLAQPLEYEEPPVWIDNFYYRQEWHTGDDPGDAAVDTRADTSATVRGTSKDAVEQLVQEVARQVKADLGGQL